MTGFRGLFISKMCALLLSLLLLFGPSLWGNTGPNAGEPVAKKATTAKSFNSALQKYNNGSYEQAKTKLLDLLNLNEGEVPELKAKVYLLLGACYENLKEMIRAKGCFLELKEMLDKGLIDQVPTVEGIDPGSFAEYREVFGDTAFFNHKKPTAVYEVIKKNVVHAPRKSIEEKRREKKKKKFPWLLAVGSVVVVGIAAVLLLSKKEKKEEAEIPDIKWIKIPAGEFLMGDNFNEGDADELPAHKVYLDEYYISKYEITIGQYFDFCEDVGRAAHIDLTRSMATGWREISADLPIYEISWDDAKTYCDWLSRLTGENINLPTEAQWEKAARGADSCRYPWGNNQPDANKAYYDQSIATSPYLYPKVYSYPAGVSPFGLHHMAGNAAEWCRDWYSAAYYSGSPKNNPTGPAGGSRRVIRGGAYYDSADGIRSANRDSQDPKVKSHVIGFRIVKEK